MAWNPNVPTVTNRVQDDLDAIRENFQHLDQLAERVDELQTVSELAPIANDLQTVSGLAPVANELQTVSGLAVVADELQAVSGLAAYVQALLDSRIVDHNLDVADPPNGWYVRWENGLQVCFVSLSLSGVAYTTTIGPLYPRDSAVTWTYPAVFNVTPIVVATWERGIDDSYKGFIPIFGISTSHVSVRPVLPIQVAGAQLSHNARCIAIGLWKRGVEA